MSRKKPVKRAPKRIKGRQKRSVLAYPLVIFMLICAGIFLVAWTLRAGADDIHVTAKVASQPVTEPAVITVPVNGAHVKSIPIQVSGTCPAHAAYVKIFDNNVMRGAAFCQAGSFSLLSDLFSGQNSLTAHVFNSTDDEGPVSTPVNVYYDVSSAQSANPLSLTTEFIYKGYHIGQQVEWPISLRGGVAPYAVSVDWGDGTMDLFSRSQAGEFMITHTYDHSNSPNNIFTIKIKAIDANWQNAYLQFFVIITKDVTQTGTIFSKPPPSFVHDLSWLWLAWPLYLIILLMAVSYKLGEREELIILCRKGLLRR